MSWKDKHTIIGFICHLVLMSGSAFFLGSGKFFEGLVLLGFVAVISSLIALK